MHFIMSNGDKSQNERLFFKDLVPTCSKLHVMKRLQQLCYSRCNICNKRVDLTLGYYHCQQNECHEIICLKCFANEEKSLTNSGKSNLKGNTWSDCMIPKDTQIKEVDIYYDKYIQGMTFFDRDGEEIFQFGAQDQNFKVETIFLQEGEVIIGVSAKLLLGT